MAKHTVLVADHQKTVLDLVKKVLSDDGYEAHAAGSSREAIDIARRVGPELLIINASMPLLSGVEAARQIARDAKCKVLFLSDLAEDSDFREMLRGLRQQGCECSAIGIPFERDELLAHVRREIGPAGILTGRDEAQSPMSSTPHSAAAPARAPLPDYQPLLEMTGTQLYARNAFRVTALEVDASLRDISRQVGKLEMMAKLGVNGNEPQTLSNSPATVEEIRAALQSLKVPEQRLLHEFFWFWPTNGDCKSDPAIAAIKMGSLGKAEEVWKSLEAKEQELISASARLDSACSETERRSSLQKRKELERSAAVSTHNLAVLYHFQAFTFAPKTARRVAVDETNRIAAWASSFKYWSKLRNQHGFWEVLIDRIRSVDDPRLGIEIAEMIWNSLPLALLSINAQFAVTAAEARNFEEAGAHRRLMKESGLGDSYVRGALCRSLTPLQQELARLCQTAVTDSLQTPEKAFDIIQKLFQDKKKYLQTFNYLLGAGDPLRDSAHDLVAQSARTGLVAYANKTENWEVAQPLFEECLALAESKSLRSSLEDDLEMLAGNAAAQIAARRTQATAAPRPPTPAQPQPQSTPAAASVPVSGRLSPLLWMIIAAVIVIGICAIMAAIGDQSDKQSSHAPEAQTSQATSSNFTPSPAPTSGTYSTPSSTNTEEIQSLKRTIERNRTTLRQIENTRSNLKSRIATLKSQIESDKAILEQMKRDHNLGYKVDADLYELTRQRHNSEVTTYNSLIDEYNSSLPAYKSLLSSTNSQIDRYNALVRSQ